MREKMINMKTTGPAELFIFLWKEKDKMADKIKSEETKIKL